MQAIDARLIN